jgi:hypothetical protein
MTSYLEKNLSQKRGDRVAQSVGLDFKPEYHKKKKTQERYRVVESQ